MRRAYHFGAALAPHPDPGELAIIFATFGLFAPRNATVVAALFVCALSVSGAILLILEMNSPFAGLMKISSAPMRDALANLGL